ncbi:tetratricopeptide repeat protein [Herbaspirillum seropedicae]|uniref:tetratricopeptide repeat protein n=1 Tax=Herbaspirillum seropedicae TaxID=964 RepID=UPI003F8D04B1
MSLPSPPTQDPAPAGAHYEALLRQAIDAHMAGRLDQACAIYEAVLEADPIHPLALHYYGIWLHQDGQHDEALDKLELASALEPDNVDWHNDRGNVLFALQQPALAEQAYADALALRPDDHTIWNNLGAVLLQQDKRPDAISAFERALQIDPDFLPSLLHLGGIHEAAGDKMQASHYQCRAYVLPPLEGKSWEMLGISFYFLGRLPEAAEAYRAWLREEPDNPIAAHMLAACSQADVPPRASDRYIESHFDRYAETFEANLLQSLGYRGPRLIAEGLALIAPPAHQFAAIDIGCGTGLCGGQVAPYSHHLVGVDLAGKMLEKAAATGHYARLEKAEIGHYLATHPQSCDLVTAADTMIYFGDLAPVMQAVALALRSGGHFVFTVEALTGADVAPQGHALHASGRYRHGRDYVRGLLQAHGFTLLHDSDQVLREEVRQPVAGMLFVARRA